MNYEQKYKDLVNTIQGRREGINSFLDTTTPEDQKYKTIQHAKGAVEELAYLEKLIEKQEKC